MRKIATYGNESAKKVERYEKFIEKKFNNMKKLILFGIPKKVDKVKKFCIWALFYILCCVIYKTEILQKKICNSDQFSGNKKVILISFSD